MSFSKTTFSVGGPDNPKARRVRVPNRDEEGIVISEGENIGRRQVVRCMTIHFQESGEVANYALDKIEFID